MFQLDGESVELPVEVSRAVRHVPTALADGRPVVVAPQQHLVTPHEVAALLNVSRAELDRILERGDLPFRMIGRHRRIVLKDVLAYHRRRARQV